MERKLRTDLADEQRTLTPDAAALPGVKASEETRRGFRLTIVEILDEQGAKALCKPIGKYVTVELDALLRRRESSFAEAAGLLAEVLREQIGPEPQGGTLVAGLGNAAVTPDAVGPLALRSVLATRHLKASMPEDFAGFREVSALPTGVLGSTGIESAEMLRSVCAALSPARVVAVDALASTSFARLCRTVQISNAGIVPGSGVGNDRAELCQRTLGAPVLAVGVPTVVDAASFTDDEGAKGMFVTPRDIDASVRDIARLIGYAINLALHDGLTVEDVDTLIS